MYSEYHAEIVKQMEEFAKDPRVIFLGQQTASENFYNTLNNISLEKRVEQPVAEELQLGMSIGLAIEGYLPISIYQRIDFLPRAMDQLVNHLNLIPTMSRGIFTPKIIIRTTIGNKKPIDAGPQHTQDLTELFKIALNFPVIRLDTVKDVKEAYNRAREGNSPILIIERQELYYV